MLHFDILFLLELISFALVIEGLNETIMETIFKHNLILLCDDITVLTVGL